MFILSCNDLSARKGAVRVGGWGDYCLSCFGVGLMEGLLFFVEEVGRVEGCVSGKWRSKSD